MLKIILPTAILFSMNTFAQVHQSNIISFKWEKVASLPPSKGQAKSPGFAGPINGVSHDVFITAGGANFPNAMPWEGGKKYYSDEIYLLEKKGQEYIWKSHNQKLPEPIAYCGVTSTPMGIVCVGGENEEGLSKKSFLITWDAKPQTLLIKQLPDLPVALTNVAVANHENTIYAAGGDEANKSSNKFFTLNLNDQNPAWESLPDLPFALANATLIFQKDKVYLIGGRTKTKTGISDLHGTTFAYSPKLKTWTKLADICDGKNPTNLSAAAGIALGNDYILMIGGDNGKTFHQIETYLSKIAQSDTDVKKEKLIKEKNSLVINHKGFSKKLLLYHIPSNCWTGAGEYPFFAQVTTTAVRWNDKIIVSNGEIKPGIRTPDVIEGEVLNKHE